MHRRIFGMMMFWLLLLLTACSQRLPQASETAGNIVNPTENTIYRRMQQEQKKAENGHPQAPLKEQQENVHEKTEDENILLQQESTGPGTYDLRLVFIGDETFEKNTSELSIPKLCMEKCQAQGYVLTVGGSGAATEDAEVLGNERWKSTSLVGVIKAVRREIPLEIFADTTVQEVLDDKETDLLTTDYFILAYGLNDFRHGTKLSNEEDSYDLRTYAGALRAAIGGLRDAYPGAEIILCSPYYCQFYRDGWMIGDSNIYDQGKGTLRDYMGTCEYIAGEQQVLFFNAYDDLGIDGYTADDDLQDGIYLTDRAKNRYADLLAGFILANEEQKNN